MATSAAPVFTVTPISRPTSSRGTSRREATSGARPAVEAKAAGVRVAARARSAKSTALAARPVRSVAAMQRVQKAFSIRASARSKCAGEAPSQSRVKQQAGSIASHGPTACASQVDEVDLREIIR